jgi:outer membrane cobalamin receptor
MVYHPHPYLAVRMLFGQAFRAPSIAERFMQHELGGGTLFKPNPNLKPERMDVSLETGLRWRLGDVVNLDIAYFHYHYRDMIYWVDISAEEGVSYRLFQVRNLNQALMQGAEIGSDVRWRHLLWASIGYTYLDAKDRSPNRSDDLLAYRVRHSLFFSVDAHRGRFTFSVNGRYQSEIEEVFLYPLEAPDAFFMANVKATVRLKDRLSLSVSANNLLDTQYEELARYAMPGRNWIFGTSLEL